jgi:hypothetical protein
MISGCPGINTPSPIDAGEEEMLVKRKAVLGTGRAAAESLARHSK